MKLLTAFRGAEDTYVGIADYIQSQETGRTSDKQPMREMGGANHLHNMLVIITVIVVIVVIVVVVVVVVVVVIVLAKCHQSGA